ncbi:hypothetical protein [Kocuria rosea]|uniref:hypothetical protein n=1 Tax=Kocuria rosea TaxID=1275 RepID=UPI00203F36A2|nr:hypothetical protein [Kocuria rosea]MCM3689381.1 hypothetical protein [Kocuria rosea]
MQPGEPVQVWYRGQLQCVATVEEVAPSLDVVWVREARGGYRRLIHIQDTDLRHHPPRHGGRGDR